MLVATSILIFKILLSTRRLYLSSGKKFSFDQFVLLIESLKLMALLVCVIFFSHQAMFKLVAIIQSLIQFLICIFFVKKVVGISKLRQYQRVVSVL